MCSLWTGRDGGGESGGRDSDTASLRRRLCGFPQVCQLRKPTIQQTVCCSGRTALINTIGLKVGRIVLLSYGYGCGTVPVSRTVDQAINPLQSERACLCSTSLTALVAVATLSTFRDKLEFMRRPPPLSLVPSKSVNMCSASFRTHHNNSTRLPPSHPW